MAYPAYPAYQQALYYPPPPVQPTTDVFRRQYADRLRALTFNSRPIIQDLSMLAMAARDRNDWDGMQAVVEEIELAVLRVSAYSQKTNKNSSLIVIADIHLGSSPTEASFALFA